MCVCLGVTCVCVCARICVYMTECISRSVVVVLYTIIQSTKLNSLSNIEGTVNVDLDQGRKFGLSFGRDTYRNVTRIERLV